ncbi:unnamed protein product [Auanema sp. JU1783]|nr:unnamed protein product [Auanema sp. JU1783]
MLQMLYIRQLVVSSFILIPIIHGLKCYTEQGFINQTNLGNLTECYGVAYSCSKTVNYNTGTYAKSCSPSNCTNPNDYSSNTAGCFNNTRSPTFSGENVPLTSICCCYGDGCNSAPSPVNLLLSVVVASTSFIFSFF